MQLRAVAQGGHAGTSLLGSVLSSATVVTPDSGPPTLFLATVKRICVCKVNKGKIPLLLQEGRL